jgi:hypothetical protein
VDTSTSAAIITTGESSGGLLDAAKLVSDSVEVQSANDDTNNAGPAPARILRPTALGCEIARRQR